MAGGINYVSSPGGATLTTELGAGLGAAGGLGIDTSFFKAMAERQAALLEEERRKAALREARENRRQTEMDDMRKTQFNTQMHDHSQAQEEARKQAMRDVMSAGSHPDEVHYFKNFGIGKGGDFGGPVEVAPGTFGAYRASLPGSVLGAADAAAKRGLTPGLAGQRLGGTDMLLGAANNEPTEAERKRRADAEGGGRMSLGQAGIGLGYQHIRGDKDE